MGHPKSVKTRFWPEVLANCYCFESSNLCPRLISDSHIPGEAAGGASVGRGRAGQGAHRLRDADGSAGLLLENRDVATKEEQLAQISFVCVPWGADGKADQPIILWSLGYIHLERWDVLVQGPTPLVAGLYAVVFFSHTLLGFKGKRSVEALTLVLLQH